MTRSGKRYRRNLPHINSADRPLYITFCTMNGWELPESVRQTVLEHCLAEHGMKYWLHCAVVMPDHVHLILSAGRDEEGRAIELAEMMNGIKGASAHSVNQALGRTGHVWQDESFDHVLRSSETVREKKDYVKENPVRKGLVKRAAQWPWYWEDK